MLNELRQVYKNATLQNIQIIKRFNWTKICDKKWTKVNDLSSGHYSPHKNIKFKTSLLRSDFYDCTNADIVVKGRISVRNTNHASITNQKIIFNNNALFTSSL